MSYATVRRYGPTLLLYALANSLCLILVGYGRVRLNKILNLAGDTTQVVNFAKSYIDGFGFRFNPRLGSPGVQDNMYFPTFDFTGRLILWILSRFTTSAELSYHLLYVIGVILMTTGMFYGLSKLAIRPFLSLVGTCSFILTPFFASRIIGHDFLSLYYGAAFGGTLSVLVASLDQDKSAKKFFEQPEIWVLIWFTATSGLYYCFFTCMFVCLGGLMNAAWQRRLAPLVLVLVIVAIVLPLVLVTGYGGGIVDVFSGRIPQVARGSFEQLELGLNPAEAVGSLAVLPGLGWTLDSYKVVFPMILGVKGLYEWPSAILCLVIFAAPVLVAVLAREVNERVSKPWIQLIQISAIFIVFGFLYAIRGGISYYFNLFISGNIRGTDRIMPFLTFFAILILCAVAEMALSMRRKWIGQSLAAFIVACLAYGCWPEVGALARKQQMVLSNKSLLDSIASTRQMLLAKDTAAISDVLQLPHVAWPEQAPIRTFDAYAHQNAFILDRVASTTRWSYGASVLQPGYQAVKKAVTDHEKSGLDLGARDLGFDAILIEKAAYTADELAQLRANIEYDLGDGCMVFNDDFRVLYALHPKPNGCIR